MPTYRLDIEYEGARYHGWQEQLNARSIAGELRRAVGAAGGELIEAGGAGRTDAGVHALGQTAHLRLRGPVEPERFRRQLNDALSADIHVLSVLAASDTFHARHDAVSRVYLYQISRRRAAHAKRHVWWVRRALDAGRMARAAARLEGRHDFALFCERPAEQSGTIVVVDSAEVAESGALVLVRLAASHFLWKMVRRAVGVLVRVGTGECPAEDLEDLLSGRLPAGAEQGIAGWTAPAAGLFLERVVYPDEPPVGPIAPVVRVPGEPAAAGRLFTGRASDSSTPRAGGRGSASGTRADARPSARDRRGRGR